MDKVWKNPLPCAARKPEPKKLKSDARMVKKPGGGGVKCSFHKN